MSAQVNPNVLMSVEEATDCLTAIKTSFATTLEQLRTFNQGEGWRALQYPSLIDCLQREMGIGRAQAFNWLRAANLADKLSTAVDSPVKASVKALNAIAKLPQEVQEQVYVAAEQLAHPKPVETPHVEQAYQGFNRVPRGVPIPKGANTYKLAANRHCPTCTC